MSHANELNGDISGVDLSHLSQSEQKELAQAVAQESQKAMIQDNIHQLTDRCFKRCITSAIRSSKLDNAEDTCMANCVGRFLDSSKSIISQLEKMKSVGI